MMRLKIKNSGVVFVGFFCLISVFLWLLAAPLSSRIGSFSQLMLSLSDVSALVGTVLYSLTLFLSARLKVFEKIFHGLNDVYGRHNQFGQLALVLLLFHPFLLLPMYAPSFQSALIFLLPGSNWAKNWGIFSLSLMVVLIVITLYLRPRYNLWKWTHKFLGLAFFLGAMHVWMIPSDSSRYLPLRIYLLGLAGLGLSAFFYRTLFGKFLVPRFRYEVSQIKKLNSSITELSLKAVGKMLSFEPGQFIFIHFPKSTVGSESHPFSIASSPTEPELRLAIKALGDYTSKVDTLKVGDPALIEGPYGVFTNKATTYKNQIWVAGGIGVTPFISMVQSLKANEGYHIDLFYCLKNVEEAVYKDLLEGISRDPGKGLNLHLFYSEERGRLDAEILQAEASGLINKDIFMCAPPLMIQSLRGQLVKKNIPLNLIHSEEFNF